MFTGRWAYELSTRPDRPLDDTYPTLAEFLRRSRIRHRGFAANTYFCSRWYGLGRGFMHYEDVALTPLEILRSSIMGRYLVSKASPYNSSRPTAYFERKDAVTINDEVLAWLSNRPAGRPFFAFLNYYDAHDPYLAPKSAAHPFGRTPASSRDFATLRDWLEVVKTKVPRHEPSSWLAIVTTTASPILTTRSAACSRELDSKGLLENTLVVVTADHGELIGERGEFGHGQSLHHEVVNVPLLVVAPRRVPSGRIVPTPVSLRDLPATVVDLLGLGQRVTVSGPFAGSALVVASGADSPENDERDLDRVRRPDEQGRDHRDNRAGRSGRSKQALYSQEGWPRRTV